MPVSVCNVRSDGSRKFVKPLHRKSHVLQLVNVARVSLYLGVKLSNLALGSSDPRSELILFDQALGETVNETLQRVLLFETPGFESLRVL